LPIASPGVTPSVPRPLAVFLLIAGLCSSSACSLPLPGLAPEPLATSLQELVPHADRDHFVFVWERLQEDQRIAAGIQVEHVSALEEDRVFEVLLSEDGAASGRVRILDEDDRIAVLVEDDLTRGVRYTYSPPLPQLHVPLFPGETRHRARVEVTRLADESRLGSFEVTQTVRVTRAAPGRTRLGPYDDAVAVDMTRTIEYADKPLTVRSSLVLVPGIGEVRSQGYASEEPTMRRELACAIVGGHAIGSCRDLIDWLAEMDDAGSTDLR
jgi:hypothetical protein